MARLITIAAKKGGGDPQANASLRLAIEKAKYAKMPKDNIERAIRRGAGEDKDAAAFEELTLAGYGPHGAALMVDCVTDNRNRTISELRHAFSKFGGNMTLPLQSVDFGKTFPKYKKAEGETVLLVHPGPRYQDENIVISNVRIVRGSESQARNSCFVVFELLNRGDPCDVRVVVNALDSQGRFMTQIDVPSERRLDTAESSILKRRLDGQGAALENQMITLKVSQVERSNVLVTLVNGSKQGSDGSQNRAKEEKIRLLKEAFLRERVSSP